MAMERILAFNSPQEHYRAEACIIDCFDDRFWRLRKLFIKQRGFKHVDLIQVAGGAQALAGPDGPGKDFLLNQIRISVEKHTAPLLILKLHRNCAMYGAFGDRREEYEHLENELKKATIAAKRVFPSLAVESYISDFDGLYRI